jgi:site-specific recombinase XerD
MKKQYDKNIVNKYIFKYLKYLEIVKGRSSKTIIEYKRKLEFFFKWLNWKKPETINKETIWKFRIYLTEKKLDKKTQSYYLIVLRNFLKFLKNEGKKVLDPTLIELPKIDMKPIEILSEEELKKLLEYKEENNQNIIYLRNKAIIETLFSTGLRVSELCKLNRDIDLKKGEIIIKGKGGRIRVVFLSQRAINYLNEYLKMRNDNNPALFVSFSKNSQFQRLTPRSVQKIIKNYSKKLGISKNIHPHTLRHQLATILISKGADIRFVQDLLGHKNISTTQVYTHITKPKLKEIFKKYIDN